MTAMTEVKTADLIGPALDWAVANVSGALLYTVIRANPLRIVQIGEDGGMFKFSPSTDWSYGGPLIDKHRPDMQTGPGGKIGAYLNNNGGDPAPLASCTGDTYLVALCRAIVTDKLGDTVSVPKELMP